MAKKPKPITRTKIKTVDAKYAGLEPVLAEVNDRSDIEFGKALSWYNYTYDISDGLKWLYEYMNIEKFDKSIISKLKQVSDNMIPTTICWIAKMALNGTKFSEENKLYVSDRINQVISHNLRENTNEIVPSFKRTSVNLQDRTLQKNNHIFTQYEELFDENPEFNLYEFLKANNITPSAANFIKNKIDPLLEEVMSDDDQVKEAFGKNLKKWQKIYQTKIDDIDRFLNNNKVAKVRKPRTPKAIPVPKIVEKLKYKTEDVPMKLTSVNPTEIVGSQSLWVFDTKSRMLQVYTASDEKGLSVRGTTIINYDETSSEGKRLRKPEEVIKSVLSAGKVGLRKIMNDVKTVKQSCNGRINMNMIILRVTR